MLQPFGILTIKTKPARLRKSNGELLVGRLATLTEGLVSRKCLNLWDGMLLSKDDAHLCLFCKIVNNMVTMPLPDYIQPNPQSSRRDHSRTFCPLHTAKNYYKYSFFPLLFVQGNTLPEDVVSLPSLDIFKAAVGKLQHSKP